MAYGNRNYRRRRLGGPSCGYGRCAPFGQTLTPMPYGRKRKYGDTAGAPIRQGRRVRPRTAGYTQTKQRKRVRFNKAKKTGDNTSFSNTRFGTGFRNYISKAIYKQIIGRRVEASMSASYWTSTQGKQSAASFTCLSKTDLDAIATACNSGTSTSNNVRCFLGYAKQRILFRNQSNSMAKLVLYDVSSKRTPIATTIDDPIEAWNKGLEDMNAVATNSSVIGVTPFHSPEFRRYFKVQRVTALDMEPGMQHEHTVIHKLNTLANSVNWQNASMTTYAPYTSFVIAVVHGSLAHDHTNAANVSITPIYIDYLHRLEWSYGYIPGNTPSFAIADGVPKAIADLDMMGENQDADLDPVNA